MKGPVISTQLVWLFLGMFGLVATVRPETNEPNLKWVPAGFLQLAEDQEAVPEVARLHKTFLTAWDEKVESTAGPKLHNLREKYAKALQAAYERARSKGDLELTLALKNELQVLGFGGVITEPNTDQSVPEILHSLRTVYHQSAARISAELQPVQKALGSQLASELRKLKVGLTKQERLDEALVVDIMLEAVVKEVKQFKKPGVADLEANLLAAPTAAGSSPPLRNFTDVANLLPFGFRLKKAGDIDLEAMEKANQILGELFNRPVRWIVTLDSIEDAATYCSSGVLRCTQVKVRLGGEGVTAQVSAYFTDRTPFAKKSKGNMIRILARVGHCRLYQRDGGTIVLDLANAKALTTADLSKADAGVPPIPELKILSASWGSGGSRVDVTDLVADTLLRQRSAAWATRGFLKADPAPYWQKNLSVSYQVGEHRRSTSRHEGSALRVDEIWRK